MIGTSPRMTQPDEKTAGHLKRYAALFQEQIANGWPYSFTFPEPQDYAESAALHLIVAEIEKKIGMRPINLTSESGDA
jgi:hypothetical protein